MSAYGERIASMEIEVRELKREFQEHKRETAENFKDLNHKLDELLALRNKGAGILWLLGGAGVTGILTIMSQVFHWFKG